MGQQQSGFVVEIASPSSARFEALPQSDPDEDIEPIVAPEWRITSNPCSEMYGTDRLRLLVHKLYHKRKLLDQSDARLIMGALTALDPAADAFMPLLTVVSNATAHASNQEILREMQITVRIAAMIRGRWSTRKGTRLMLLQCFANMAVDQQNHATLAPCLERVVESLQSKDETEASIALQALTNLSLTVLPEEMDLYTKCLPLALSRLWIRGEPSLDVLRFLVNISCCPDMVPRLLSVEAPKGILLILDTDKSEVLIRSVTLMLCLASAVYALKITYDKISTVNSDPFFNISNSLYHTIFGINARNEMKGKLISLTHHPQQEIRKKCSELIEILGKMELNVKQSGIECRSFATRHYKNRGGKIFKAVDENYLRNDISCGLAKCSSCPRPEKKVIVDNEDENTLVPGPHAVILDADCFTRFIDVFDCDALRNLVICQTAWDSVKKKSIPAYKKMNSHVYETKSNRFFVFLNKLHAATWTPVVKGESELDREVRCMARSAEYLAQHWKQQGTVPVIICGDEDAAAVMKNLYANTFSLKEYVGGMISEEKTQLLANISVYDKGTQDGRVLFDEYLSNDEVIRGMADGTIKRAQFTVSRENYREATALVDGSLEWFIQGKHCNRAINGDTVAVCLLPESEWTAPERKLVLRDVEEDTLNPDATSDNEEENDEPSSKKARKGVVPTAKVVAIIRRNWRAYCGVLMPSVLKERLIPRIRVETEQAEQLASQRIVVAMDAWPRDSKYPLGHYVRTLGNIGERGVENEVLLLEHDIPHAPFSEAVLSCLPKGEWNPSVDANRRDLQDLCICSVDPVGCTDIDDALHARYLPDGTIEVGVHIADVTHFVLPGTAMDDEAAKRGTTVYFADRRIDMLPEMLSSNLCSLRGGEQRYAFSVIWTMTKDVKILSTKYHKSLIRSKAAMTYEAAQERIDDKNDNSEITQSLRLLNQLSKVRTSQRRADGSLILASSEIRFDMDWESKTPKGVQMKKHLDTHSMVEEFMLLANISVAEKILSEYPDCALLRRHPVPSESSYKPLLEAASSRGLTLNATSGKALADSLDCAVDPSNPMVNTLLRMTATRCMTQAVYFSAGTIPVENYQHFGLACPIYTHFTSPIRRYADVIVHRLLAACIKADTIVPRLLSQSNVTKIANNINYRQGRRGEGKEGLSRHKQAQYAGRASTQLITLAYFQGKNEEADAFVAGVRKNGIQIFVPKYGIEAVVVLKEGTDTNVDVAGGKVTHGTTTLVDFQKVRVRIGVEEKNFRRRIAVQLLHPAIPGLSTDFDLSSFQGTADQVKETTEKK